jgi:tRNA C32,U32 (ribose-2'-O)-methylase TrmJ
VLLVLGRESSGLTKDELAVCDASLFIPTRSSLNLAHAAAVLVYQLVAAPGVAATNSADGEGGADTHGTESARRKNDAVAEALVAKCAHMYTLAEPQTTDAQRAAAQKQKMRSVLRKCARSTVAALDRKEVGVCFRVLQQLELALARRKEAGCI